MSRTLILALALSTGVAGAGAPQTDSQYSCTGSADIVCVETGAVRGIVADGIRAFKGIPYAKPPTGDLRFRPTQPAERWPGILVADRFGSVCPQIAGANKVEGSEDCLTLNIWTPH